MTKILTEHPKPLPENEFYTSNLQLTIYRLLDKNPTNRPSVSEVLADIPNSLGALPN
jgi:hypothetical protein